ncbi:MULTISPECIES: TonB-dependent receptor [unclassified Bradyrhizobium]|uniref:TonB-dependent receptor n=1 Tax=unclassified Bradyrhizobium TaxID=2631580 RepID=UPI00247ABB9D|nr:MULTISPECIES: TonB-dependent receptor [unclassified Bradyrhizobium]WGS23701.1 TonB-dependent receptor [Bradyrhizobium sp. ISRA463]WGS31440.1 TonB-dependent receptor [Bradyrhizobium sp. ISRA464]
MQAELTPTASRPGALPQSYPGGQVARGGQVGLLGNRDFMDTPFNITSYTAKKIEDQQASTVADVVSNDPSIRFTGQTGGIVDSFFIRGFPIGEGNLGEIAFNGVYGVAPNYRVFTDYVERIEVIKGPTALLYGMAPNSSVGGTINIVPKRASDVDLTRITTDYATRTQLGGHLDVSRRFGENREFGVRFNGSYHNGDTPLDNQGREAHVGAAAFDYRGNRFRASLDFIDQEEKFDAPTRPFLVATGIAVPSAPDGRRNVTQPWEWSKIHDKSLLARTEYDVTEAVTVFADAGGGRTQVDRLFGTPTILNSAGDTTSTPGHFKFDIERNVADAGLRARFDTAAISHTVTFQGSYYTDQLSRGSTSGTPVLSNIYAPITRPEQFVPAPATVPKLSDTELTGLALADTLSILQERLQLTVGVRQQGVRSNNFNTTTGAVTASYDQAALTPMVGLVIKPWNNIAFYANYIEGLSKGDIAPMTASNAGEVLSPYISKQQEAGVKIDFGMLATTISAFEITKPSGQLGADKIFRTDGEQRNRGLEFNVFGEVQPGIRVLGGVTLIDAELTKTNIPAALGKTPIGVPHVQANLSTEWDTPFVPGLTLVASTVYTGSQYIDATNTQSIPAWTRLDLGARYSTRIDGRPVTLRALVQNVFDTNYWSGVSSFSGLSQGAPRTVLVSLTTDF